MAYRTRRASRRAPRRYARRTFRRSTRAKARYRRPAFRRTSRMPTRRILNLTSKKKQDNMIATVTTNAGGSAATGSATIAATTGGTFLWRCTSRDRINNTSGDDTSVAVRNSDTCFMRGLKEYVQMATNSGSAWTWRRICFTGKGSMFPAAFTAIKEAETNLGWVRLLTNIRGTPNQSALTTVLFRGEANVDWLDVHNAKVDTTRVTVKYDHQRIIRSGNASGTTIFDNRWYPMNQNLVYDNDESGENESNSIASTTAKPGMGDYYVVDFIDCVTPGSSDALSFLPQATLYWHEK